MRSLEIVSQMYADEEQKKADAANNVFLASKRGFKRGVDFAFEEIFNKINEFYQIDIAKKDPFADIWLESVKSIIYRIKEELED